jgi:hypothetical protein
MSEKEKPAQANHSSGLAIRNRDVFARLTVLFSLSLLLAIPGFAQQGYLIQTGLPIAYSTLTLHIQGQPVSVEYIVVSLYPMNAPPPWPTGLWLDLYLQADSGDGANKSTWGQGQWCHWWFNQVAQLENQTPGQVPFPYLEVNLPVGVVQIQTDEGIPIYPAGSVTCWQANNDFAAP